MNLFANSFSSNNAKWNTEPLSEHAFVTIVYKNKNKIKYEKKLKEKK